MGEMGVVGVGWLIAAMRSSAAWIAISLVVMCSTLVCCRTLYCVGDAFPFGLVCEDLVESAMLHGGAGIPSTGSMWIPGFALKWFFVNDDLRAWRCQRCLVVIKGPFQDGVG
jgi:hypothetical protein